LLGLEQLNDVRRTQAREWSSVAPVAVHAWRLDEVSDRERSGESEEDRAESDRPETDGEAL
jgi:hypothetical protein